MVRYGHDRTKERSERTDMKVITVYRAGSARQDAVKAESDAGGQFTANLDRGWISWAEPDVWAHPEAHGLYRYFCPGHNGQVCFYGMCDETRIRDLEGLRQAADLITPR